VHHLRKTGARDEFDGVSGSTGLTGAVDTIVILKRKRLQTEATLLISGRNQKEAELALRFDQTTGIWEPREQTEENHLTPERHEIVELLKKAPAPLRLQEIAQALGKKRANVGNLMNKLIKQGITERISYGHYQLKGGPATGSGVKSKLIEEKTPGMTVEELDALLAKKVAEIQKQIEYLCETVPSVVES
jgi:predicted transcriptional regulator